MVAVGSLALLAFVLLELLFQLPFRDWSAIRLSWSMAVLGDNSLYYGISEGPALPSIYGPVSPVFFAPALLAPTITTAMLLAGSLNLFVMILPLAFLTGVFGSGRAQSAPDGYRLYPIVFAIGSILAVDPTYLIAAQIHVDALTLGLGVLSCALLLRRSRPLGGHWAAACFAILSVWTKQTEAPLLLAQPVYLLIAHGWRTALGYTKKLIVFGAGITLLFIALFGFGPLYLNLIRIPLGHDYVNVGANFVRMFRWCVPFLVIPVALRLDTFANLRFRREGWLLLLLAGLCMLPTSTLAAAKVGGYINSYHPIYYFIAGSAAALAARLRACRSSRSIRIAAALALLPLVFVPQQMIHRSSSPLYGWRHLGRLTDNRQEQAVAFTREHPGQVFLPWHPLPTAWVDERLYHFDWAAVDRGRAGYPLSREHARAHVPRDLRYIVLPPRKDFYMRRYFPEFNRKIEVPGMEDWRVYVSGTG